MFEKLEGARRQKSWLIAIVGATLYAPTAPTLNKISTPGGSLLSYLSAKTIQIGLKMRQNSKTFPKMIIMLSSHQTFHNHIDFPLVFPFARFMITTGAFEMTSWAKLLYPWVNSFLKSGTTWFSHFQRQVNTLTSFKVDLEV